MIAKVHRFHGRKAIGQVYRHGQAVRGTYNSIKYVRNTRTKTYRAAVVVSRKVHKSAVVRNRIRRRIYEILRQLSPAIADPFDIIVVVYSDQLAMLEAAQLKTELETQLQKAGIVPVEQQPVSAPKR